MSVRSTWHYLYKTTSADDFAIYTPAPVELVEACNAGGALPIGHQLDFGTGWQHSRWNIHILNGIYDMIVNARAQDGGWYLPEVSREYLMGLLQGQLKRSREVWSIAQPHLSLDGQLETPEQLLSRLTIQTNTRLQAVTSRSRRQRVSTIFMSMFKILIRYYVIQKFTKRSETSKRALELKVAEGAEDADAWNYLCSVIEHLGVGGMSSEEDTVQTDKNGIKRSEFIVKRCIWRAPEITDYLKFIDQAGEQMRGTQGGKPIGRSRVDDYGTSPAPVELPRKMYNQEWLAERGAWWVENELRVSEEAFELLVLAADRI